MIALSTAILFLVLFLTVIVTIVIIMFHLKLKAKIRKSNQADQNININWKKPKKYNCQFSFREEPKERLRLFKLGQELAQLERVRMDHQQLTEWEKRRQTLTVRDFFRGKSPLTNTHGNLFKFAQSNVGFQKQK